MKKLYFLLFTFLITSMSIGQTTVFQESFETDGNGSRYTTSIIEYSDGGGDFFGRSNLNGTAEDAADLIVGSYYSLSGQDADFCFAAMDIDAANETGSGGATTQTLLFDDINIASYTNLTFAILLAEDDDGTNQDWDDGSSFIVEIDIDNSGSFTKILQFEAVELRPDGSSSTSNKEPAQDTDFDGVGDGMPLTSVFQEFTASIGSGSLVDVKLTFAGLRYGDEDISVDNVRIIDGFVASPTLTLVDGEASGSEITIGPEDLAGDLEFATTNFVVGEPNTASEGDGYIVWSIEEQGAGIHDQGTIYDTSLIYPFTPLTPELTYILTAELYDNTDNPLGVIYTLTANTLGYNAVSDIAAVRAHALTFGDGLYYEILGGSLVTHIDGYRNRHWIQDTNVSGILIYDADNIMTTYLVGDSVLGLKGQTSTSNGVLRFNPSVDSGIVGSSSNPVVPQTITISDLNATPDNYESELIELINVTFPDADGSITFGTGQNINVSDGAETTIMRTDFFGADYIGEIIPQSTLDLVGVAGEYQGTAQIYARSLADLTLGVKDLNVSNFSLYPNPTSAGFVTIISNNSNSIQAQVFDILGKQVINNTVVNNRLNVSNLNAGIYIVKLTQDNASVTKKLVIK